MAKCLLLWKTRIQLILTERTDKIFRFLCKYPFLPCIFVPNLQSAKKALRQNKRRKALNLEYKKKMREPIKKFKKLLADKKTQEAKALLPQIYKALDKAAKHGTIKKNNASRLKSRLSTRINKAL